jgi:hypothetical protein
MSLFQAQLRREAGWDVRVAIAWLIVFFGCMLIFPRWAFWLYFVPLAAFWYRYLFVRDRRDEALLRADIAGSGGSSPASCYAGEGGICISDGTHQVLISSQQPQAAIKLLNVVRDQ